MTPKKHTIIFMPSGRRGSVAANTSVLQAAHQLGIAIENICGGLLTCGKCKIQLEVGSFPKHGINSVSSHLSTISEEERRHLKNSINQNNAPHRLACTACIQGDVLITVPPESQSQKQIIRKSATKRVIEVVPTIRQVYVQVEKATLGQSSSDWERLQTALKQQWQLDELSLSLVALRYLQTALRQGPWAVTVTLWQGQEVIDIQSGYQEGAYGLAVDIGSTTIAAYLCNLRTGELLATQSTMNPQISYGEDLISRISYATLHPTGLKKMHQVLIKAINQLAKETAKQANINHHQIYEAVMVGNTTMINILLNINPIELGRFPFTLANREAMDIKATELGLRFHPGAYLYILPAQAGHVGADNVAVLLAEAPQQQTETTLIIDVGTNGEIVLNTPQGLYSTSSPTGPAFEGAQINHGLRATPGAIEHVRIDPLTQAPQFQIIGEDQWSSAWQLGLDVPPQTQPKQLAIGICGSGIIEAIAEMILTGIVLPDGRFNPNSTSKQIYWKENKGYYILATSKQSATGTPIVITQDDIRQIQLAKAALYAGAKLLMKHTNTQVVNRIILAGAFGSYISPKHALILGLIPNCNLTNINAVGNAAGDGARIALLNYHQREKAKELAKQVTYIETATNPHFQTEFVQAMHFPHQSDSFPTIKELLPNTPIAPKKPSPPRQRRK